MNNDLTFMVADNWRWLSLSLVLLLFFFCLLMEFRKKKSNSWWRALLLCSALFSLLMVAWKPAILEEQPPATAILLLPNADAKAYDSLRQLYPEALTFSLNPEAPPPMQRLPHLSYLPEYLGSGSLLFLLGEGLHEQELTYLKNYDLHYLPGIPAEGLIKLSFPQSIPFSDSLKISGQVQMTKDTLRVSLWKQGIKVDSVLVYPSKPGFILQHLPKLAGLQNYRLKVEGRKERLLHDVPIQLLVEEEKKLKIAILTSYPSFESKYLKNWLGKQGHKVYYQASMAPNRWQRESLNWPKKSFEGLNKELLHEVDLLILDQNYLQNLSNSSLYLLEEQLRQQGLGLLVLAAEGSSPDLLQRWTANALNRLSGSTREAGLKIQKTAKVLPPVTFSPVHAPDWYTLAGSGGASAVVFKPLGLGVLGYSSIVNSYSFLLEGKESAYAGLWKRILHQLLRSQRERSFVEADFPALKGQRHHLQFWAEGGEVPALILTEPNGRREVLPVLQDPYLPERWHAYHWPPEQGIYKVALGEKDSLSLAVLNADNFHAWQQRLNAQHLRSFLKEKQFAKENNKVAGKRSSSEPLPLWWFYGMFLLSMGALWLEKKWNPL